MLISRHNLSIDPTFISFPCASRYITRVNTTRLSFKFLVVAYPALPRSNVDTQKSSRKRVATACGNPRYLVNSSGEPSMNFLEALLWNRTRWLTMRIVLIWYLAPFRWGSDTRSNSLEVDSGQGHFWRASFQSSLLMHASTTREIWPHASSPATSWESYTLYGLVAFSSNGGRNDLLASANALSTAVVGYIIIE